MKGTCKRWRGEVERVGVGGQVDVCSSPITAGRPCIKKFILLVSAKLSESESDIIHFFPSW